MIRHVVATLYIAFSVVAFADPALGDSTPGKAADPVDEASSERSDALQTATVALDRFRDHGVALQEGYIHYLNNEDTFMMGEHWVNLDLISENKCELTQPTHLQYLRIDGKRTLIGTGYFCFPDATGASPPGWFGAGVTWHVHGPEFCHKKKGNLWADVFPAQMQKQARTLPNPLLPITWEALCRAQGGAPLERDVFMLHTWNWIEHPNGPFVHENAAIAFLRAGLPVPTREALDSEQGRAMLDTLRLAYRGFPNYPAAFNVVMASPDQRAKTQAIIRAAVGKGKEALASMRSALVRDDRAAYLSGARVGAAALAKMHADVLRLFTAQQRKLIGQFRDMQNIHDYRHHGRK